MGGKTRQALQSQFSQQEFEQIAPALSRVESNMGKYGDMFTFNPVSSFDSIDPFAYRGDKKEGASRLAADVIRAQYADYENRFQPIEDLGIGLITKDGTKDLEYDLARTRDTITSTAENLEGQQARALGRFGLQGAGRGIANSIETTGALVGGLNAARLADEERRLNFLGGGNQVISTAKTQAAGG